MDVNAIGSNINSIKVYSGNNSNDTQQYDNTTINTKSEISEIGELEKKQGNQGNEENTDEMDKRKLDKAVKKLNKFLEDDKTHAEYSVHKDLGTIMIKIIDDDTHQVILEVPSKKILDMVASMCKEVGLLDKKA